MDQSRAGFDFGMLFCLLFVLVLQIYPLESAINVWRPDFLLLLCCYIAFYRSVQGALWFALFAGLLSDIICGCVLGKHALALTLAIALLMVILPRIKHGWLLHEALAVAIVTLVGSLVFQSLSLFVRDTVQTSWVVFPALSTFFAWPLVSWLFSKMIPVRQQL